jgi:hypothetical protein
VNERNERSIRHSSPGSYVSDAKRGR